jgi:arylsulfatase A-like enzyme
MEDWIGQTYAPSEMVAEAERFIDQHRDRPFFLYLPFIEPHVAMHPPRASVEQFPTDWDTEPYRGQCGYLPHPRPHAGYAAMISDLDGYVGRVLARLDANQLSDQTLVVFTSDNGTTHGGRDDTHFHVGGADAAFFNSTADLRGFKGSVYEGGIRVPMIARYPNVIPARTIMDTPSYFADWFPTICEALRIDPPAGLDGDSLWGTLTGVDPLVDRKPMVWVFPEYGGQVAVRLGNFKVVRQGLKTARPGVWEVYDLEQDRSESRNVASTHPDVIARAIEVLRHEVDENPTFALQIPEAE